MTRKENSMKRKNVRIKPNIEDDTVSYPELNRLVQAGDSWATSIFNKYAGQTDKAAIIIHCPALNRYVFVEVSERQE